MTSLSERVKAACDKGQTAYDNFVIDKDSVDNRQALTAAIDELVRLSTQAQEDDPIDPNIKQTAEGLINKRIELQVVVSSQDPSVASDGSTVDSKSGAAPDAPGQSNLMCKFNRLKRRFAKLRESPNERLFNEVSTLADNWKKLVENEDQTKWEVELNEVDNIVDGSDGIKNSMDAVAQVRAATMAAAASAAHIGTEPQMASCPPTAVNMRTKPLPKWTGKARTFAKFR